MNSTATKAKILTSTRPVSIAQTGGLKRCLHLVTAKYWRVSFERAICPGFAASAGWCCLPQNGCALDDEATVDIAAIQQHLRTHPANLL